MIIIYDYQKIQFRKRVAKNLKRIRKKKHITQAELARKAYVDRSFISTIETGKSSISLDTLYKLKKILKVDFKQFFV